MTQEQTLYIPMGVKPEAEWFPGFGRLQLAQSILGSGLAVILSILIWLFKGSVPFAMLTFLTGVSASVMMTTKDRHNLSVLDQVRFMIVFKRSQKRFPYRAINEWPLQGEKL